MVACGPGELTDKAFIFFWILQGGLECDVDLPAQLLDRKIIKILAAPFARAQQEIHFHTFHTPNFFDVALWELLDLARSQSVFDPVPNPRPLEPSADGTKVFGHLNHHHA